MTTCCRYFLLLFYSLIEALETLSTVGLSVADSSSWTDALDTLSAVSGASFLEAPLTASTFFPALRILRSKIEGRIADP